MVLIPIVVALAISPHTSSHGVSSPGPIDYLFSHEVDARYGGLLHHAVFRNKFDALEVTRRLLERGAPTKEIKYKNDPAVYWECEPFGLGPPLHRGSGI
jgi:hypothetical protein